MVRGLSPLSCACPWQDIRLELRLVKQLVPELFGPVAPDTFRRWHYSGAPNADPGGRPSMELPPLALSRLANLTHAVTARLSLSMSPRGSTSTAVCCASSTSNSSPTRTMDTAVPTAACSYHGSSRRVAPAKGRVRLTLPESVTSCSYASSTCAIASESHRIACGTWSRQLCAQFQQASVGGPRGPNQPMSSPCAPSSRSHLLQT